MSAPDVLAGIATRILSQDPDPVVRLRLLRDVLCVPGDVPELAQARQALDTSRWVRELAREQWDDGSWGRLHSQDSRAKQRTPTTEAGVERALALGLDVTHPILQRASAYLAAVLQGTVRYRDRAEKNDRWPTGVRLFAAATLAQIDPKHRALDEVWDLWSQVAARTFSSGAYDAEAEATAHRALTGASVRGTYLVVANKYALTLLSARPATLSGDVGRALVRWVWHRQDGIGYFGVPLACPPAGTRDLGSKAWGWAQAGRLERWCQSLELLSRFPAWRDVAQEAIAWLWQRRTAAGGWDLGPRVATSVALPLSESWRTSDRRAMDWTTRVLALLRRYGEGRDLPPLPDGIPAVDESALRADEPGLLPPVAPGGTERLPRYIIRRVRLAHCKRGPALCEECRRMDVERICLLDISPPHPGEVQRRVIAVQHGGQRVWREFEVVRTFETAAKARQYAAEHGVKDLEL